MIKKISSSFFLTLLVALILWWLIELSFGLFTGIDGFGFKAHKLCIELVDEKGRFDFMNLQILCTYQSFSDTSDLEKNLQRTFANLGLIHLLVASGTHLLILKKGTKFMIRPFTKSNVPIIAILFGFVLISNFCIPVTRSFFQIIFSERAKPTSFFYSHIYGTLVSSSIFLLFFPSSLFTLSFWLSLCASLCLACLSKDTLLLSVIFFFGLIPFILDFNQPSVASILVNIIITPILGPFLILNSILYVLIPQYVWFSDHLMFLIFQILDGFQFYALEQNPLPYKIQNSYKISYGLLFVLCTLLFQHLKTLRLKRLICP